MAVHSFWRLHIVSKDGNNFDYMSLWSLDFQDSSGASLCFGGTAIASSVWAGHTPDRLFPGGANDWVSNNELACWVGMQFPGAVDPARIVLSSSNTGNNFVVAALEWSDDGSTWTRAWVLTKPAAGWTLHAPVTYNRPAIGAVSAPYWGMFVETMTSTGRMVISELAFRDSSGTPIAGSFSHPGCLNDAGNYNWDLCWDGNIANYVYSVDTAGAPAQFTTAQFPAPVSVAALALTNFTDVTYANDIPATGGMYTSTDGLAWGLAWTFDPSNATGYPPPGASSTVVWRGALPPATHRRVQIVNPL